MYNIYYVNCHVFCLHIFLLQLHGKKFASDDKKFEQLYTMMDRMLCSFHPTDNSPILDLYPFLFKFRYILFRKTAKYLDDTNSMIDDLIMEEINEAKVNFEAFYSFIKARFVCHKTCYLSFRQAVAPTDC